jgi:hypothetical protein
MFIESNKEEQNKKDGFRDRNLPLTARFIKRGRDEAERPVCSICKKPFWMDINGDRVVFDRDENIVIVKYEQMICICKSCFGKKHKVVVGGDEKIEMSYSPEWIVHESFAEQIYFTQKGADLSDYGIEFKGDPNDDLSKDYQDAVRDSQFKKMKDKGIKLGYILKKLLKLK